MPFLVFRRGSFAVWDHLRSSLGIISGLGIIYGRGSFAALYRSNVVKELWAKKGVTFLRTGPICPPQTPEEDYQINNNLALRESQ